MKPIHTIWATLVLSFCLIAGDPAGAHEGEPHDQPAEKTAAPAPVREDSSAQAKYEASSQSFELVLKAPALIPGQPSTLKLYLSDYATNQPIAQATVEVEFDDLPKAVAKPVSPGIYEVSATFNEPRDYAAIISISQADRADLLTLEGIQVRAKGTDSVLQSANPLRFVVPGLIMLLVLAALWYLRRKRRKVSS